MSLEVNTHASQPLTPPSAGDEHVRRLNWGCGHHVAPGWVNCDIKLAPCVDVSCDIRHGLPFSDGAFDCIVSIHALQEIPHFDLVPTLQELRRVLKPGGVLRLCLPDFEKALDAYNRGDKSYFLIPDEDARTLSGKLIVQMLWYGWSRTLFTFEYIEELLQQAGFRAVNRCGYRLTAGDDPDIVELDNREDESIFVEATS